MGSGSSKDSRGKGTRRLFNCSSSSCFCISSADEKKVEGNESSKDAACVNEAENESARTSKKCCDNIKLSRRKTPSLPSSDDDQSDTDLDGNLQSDSGASSSSVATAAISSSRNNSGRLRSRFNFIPDGISFRLNRALSLGSSQAHSVFSNSLTGPNIDVGDHVLADLNSSLDDRNINHCNMTEINSDPDVTRINTGTEATISNYSNRTSSETSSARLRLPHRRFGQQEQFEGSVRFSRTLSVGRLRERVLRRSSLSESLYPPAFTEDRSGMNDEHGSERRILTSGRRITSSSNRINSLLADSSTVPQPIFGNSAIFNDEPGNSRDLLEHRSAFLERRRRIRSQVRALQRLGSRFESLSGHDRSCILSGQHRTGTCTCRNSNRTPHPEDDTTSRASISRIVMLAEALFEVLDEIHQQSVVLSSQPSFSSIGSVPAPKEVVESIPVKIYNRPSKTLEEAAQCYICLVEYEDGDCMRVLPCNHEFHRTCVDKWLKEIHRVCPLCRGDVCLSEASNKRRAT